MPYQRRWTHENDAIVRLRRPPTPIPNVGRLWEKSNPPLRVAPLELEVAQPLPEVCAAHGIQATGSATVRTLFYDTDAHPRFHNPRTIQESWKALKGDAWFAPVSTIVAGKWPICPRCARKVRTYRHVAYGILAIMAANFVAFIVTSYAHIEWLKPWLGSVFCPGSILGLIVIVQLFAKSGDPVKLRPIYDERFAFVQAHPKFRQALQEDCRR
ncbi:hypothetical protein ACFWPH_09990 [Nocardia sp. NPDC058499]|uniref:hypothetical protein n=1 Tax=Nocardia sp. NPDC058499 TaxID=3346530 RepID=UPI00366272DC